jgi:hypothetical protein
MSNGRMARMAPMVAGAALAALFALAPLHAGQNAQGAKPDSPAAKATPRAANGHPDLTGFWMNPRPAADQGGDTVLKSADGSVYFNAYTDISPDQKSPALVICTNEACQSPNQPPYKPEYAAKVNDIYAHAYGGNSLLDPQFDCKPLGVPRGSFGTMEIVQNDQYVAILYEASPGPVYRVIYTDGRQHPQDLDTSYLGHSVGHWDGDTLVVDVAGLNDDTWLGQSQLGNLQHTAIHSDKEHVIERWTRKGDALTYEATVEDPVMFTRPWVINPRHTVIASPDDYIQPSMCVPNDRAHLVKPTETDKFECDYCVKGSDAVLGQVGQGANKQ